MEDKDRKVAVQVSMQTTSACEHKAWVYRARQSLNRFNTLQLLLPLKFKNIENQALAAGAQPDFHPLLEAFNCQNDSPSACYNVPFDLLAKALHQARNL